MQDFFAGRIGRYRAEHRLDNGRDGWIWVSAIAEVTEIDPTGLPRQIIGSHLDVTEVKASEVALERNNRRNLAQLNLVTVGDSGSESAVFACAAQHAASITDSPRGVLHVFDDKGEVEATYRFGPSQHLRRASEVQLEGEVHDNGLLIARLTVDGRASDYDQEDKASLQIIGAEAWRLVLRIRQARKLEIQSRVLQCAVNGIVITDPEGRVEWVNPAFEQITGYALGEMAGRDLRLLRPTEHDEAHYQRLWETIKDGRSFTGEFVHRRKDGSLVTVEQIITPVVGASGQIEKFISVSEDITDRKTAESRLVYLRHHDELTGLLNRGSMVDVIDRAIAEHDRGGPGFAVLYVGLDHFKVVNDQLGRQSADKVLQRVAVILNDCLRPTDDVGRCGGDEFVVLQRMAKSADDAANLARRLAAALNSAMEADPDEVRLGASVGISVFPADQGTADETGHQCGARHAPGQDRGPRQRPLLHAGAAGSGADPGQARLRLARRDARGTNLPALSAADRPQERKRRRVRGPGPLEASELGMVSPLQFIAIAEETG